MLAEPRSPWFTAPFRRAATPAGAQGTRVARPGGVVEPIQLGAAAPALVLAVALTACGLCEHRDYQTVAYAEAKLDEPCPPEAPHALGRVSVNGPPVRETKELARQECCYVGRYVLAGAELTGELCTSITLEGRGDEAPTYRCPKRDVASNLVSWHHLRPGGSAISVGREDILSLDEGPRAGAVTLRRERCAYPVTQRTSADACG